MRMGVVGRGWAAIGGWASATSSSQDIPSKGSSNSCKTFSNSSAKVVPCLCNRMIHVGINFYRDVTNTILKIVVYSYLTFKNMVMFEKISLKYNKSKLQTLLYFPRRKIDGVELRLWEKVDDCKSVGLGFFS